VRYFSNHPLAATSNVSTSGSGHHDLEDRLETESLDRADQDHRVDGVFDEVDTKGDEATGQSKNDVKSQRNLLSADRYQCQDHHLRGAELESDCGLAHRVGLVTLTTLGITH
jgi:hypothetical protein